MPASVHAAEFLTPQRSDSILATPGGRLIGVSLAFAGGIWLGSVAPATGAWWWIAGALISLVMFLILPGILQQVESPRRFWVLLLGAVLLGGGWFIVSHHHVQPNNLAALMNDQSQLVRLRGVATTTPVERERRFGSMADFGFQPGGTYFRLRVTGLVRRDGSTLPVVGNVLVRVAETVEPFRAGATVEAVGTILPFLPPSNPGEFDAESLARSENQAGLLTVPGRDAMQATEPAQGTLSDMVRRWREDLRARASGWLVTEQRPAHRSDRDLLLAALLLGERGRELDALGESFRRVGLSHLLAISGLHLGVLAGIGLFIFRAVTPNERLQGLLLVLLVVLYLLLIEARLPVIRASIMTVAAAIGIIAGYRLHVGGLIALSGVGLLLWRPEQLFEAGFQLSFGVVLGLLIFASPLRARWFGPPDMLATSGGAVLLEWLKSALAASVVAWLVAAPIVVHHFGIFTPFAAGLSVLSLPVVTLLLALGYTKMLLAAVVPTMSIIAGAPLEIAADLMLAIVNAFDGLPGTPLHPPHPGALWSLAAMAVIVAWLSHRTRAGRRYLLVATLLLAGWLYWPVHPFRASSPLRVDMIAVGDGSCMVLRSAGTTVVYDAGSSSNLDAGRRYIIPAFEHLQIRRIDAIVISHGDLDHYSAALELVDRFRVRRVLVTPQMLRAAERAEDTSLAYFIGQLHARLVPVQAVEVGHTETFGRMHWRWLHPPGGQDYAIANDGSKVIRVEAAGRRMLLTGDLQQVSMAELLGSGDDIRADIIELPHHGSYHDLAVAFVEAVDAEVIMQSTGWTRFIRDRWGDHLTGRTRLITARDGHVWVEVAEDGTITTGMFRQPDAE